MSGGAPRRRALTRREFMSLSAAALAGVVATACGGGELPSPVVTVAAQPGQPTTAAQATAAAPAAGATTAAQGPAATTGAQAPVTAPTQFKEAPQLTEQVRAGQLPAVDQRLPKKPLVVKPIERVGKYGGTWRAATLGPADSVWLTRTVGYENLVRWDPEWKEITPNVAESFVASPDAKEFTFKLREGIKWSDGQPYTVDDIIFWYEDVANDKELNPAGGVPLWMRSGGKIAMVEKVDGFTVRFKFEEPNGLFLVNLAASGGDSPTQYPKQYLQQFHKKYNPDNVARLAQENNQPDWVKLFQSKGASIPGTPFNARWYNTDLPTLFGWRLTTGFGPGTRVVFDRNPFYFKVDPEGNQLPYIDRVTYEVTQDREVMTLKALNGEIDMQDRHIATPNNKAVFTDNQQKGQYRFFEVIPSNMNTTAITLNLTHKDPVKRQIFQSRDFRIGLSHAINRQEIIDVVYVSQGEPWQCAPRKETPFFNERLAKQYTEYDVKKANEFLDKAFPRKDAQGIRLGPDGKPISFVVELAPGAPGAEGSVEALELVRAQWQKVGVDMQVKPEDRALLYTRKDANDHDCVVWSGDGGLKDALIEMRYYFPFSFESNFAQAWSAWFNSGGNPRTEKEEPPEPTKRQMQLYDQIRITGDEAKQVELVKQILEIAAEQFYCLGISLPPNGYGIVKNNFHNVPQRMFFTGGPYINPAPTNPSQYFIQ